MNYESEALIFYHDNPEENILNLSCFLQSRLFHNFTGARSKKKYFKNKILYFSPY